MASPLDAKESAAVATAAAAVPIASASSVGTGTASDGAGDAAAAAASTAVASAPHVVRVVPTVQVPLPSKSALLSVLKEFEPIASVLIPLIVEYAYDPFADLTLVLPRILGRTTELHPIAYYMITHSSGTSSDDHIDHYRPPTEQQLQIAGGSGSAAGQAIARGLVYSSAPILRVMSGFESESILQSNAAAANPAAAAAAAAAAATAAATATLSIAPATAVPSALSVHELRWCSLRLVCTFNADQSYVKIEAAFGPRKTNAAAAEPAPATATATTAGTATPAAAAATATTAPETVATVTIATTTPAATATVTVTPNTGNAASLIQSFTAAVPASYVDTKQDLLGGTAPLTRADSSGSSTGGGGGAYVPLITIYERNSPSLTAKSALVMKLLGLGTDNSARVATIAALNYSLLSWCGLTIGSPRAFERLCRYLRVTELFVRIFEAPVRRKSIGNRLFG